MWGLLVEQMGSDGGVFDKNPLRTRGEQEEEEEQRRAERSTVGEEREHRRGGRRRGSGPPGTQQEKKKGEWRGAAVIKSRAQVALYNTLNSGPAGRSMIHDP